VDKHEVAFLENNKVSVFSLSEKIFKTEFEIKTDCRSFILISDLGIISQSRNALTFISVDKSESLLYDMRRPGLKGFLSLDWSPNTIHIPQYSLLCVTIAETSFFIDYNFKPYLRYPNIHHPETPKLVTFLHPCYLYGFYNGFLTIYMTYTAQPLETIAVPDLKYDVFCGSYQNFFISTANSLLGFASPTLDVLIPSFFLSTVLRCFSWKETFSERRITLEKAKNTGLCARY
jgi:hypothetical protein